MHVWQQLYDPLGNIWLSSLIALLPIIFFFFALTKLRLKGYVAGTITVLIALAVALFLYKMPVDRALAASFYGFTYGLWPIAWIIIAAVFLYKVSVKTGQFDIIRSSILSVTRTSVCKCCWWVLHLVRFLRGQLGSVHRLQSRRRY